MRQRNDFVRDHVDYVAKSLLRLGVPTRDLEDVTQDVLVSILNNFHKWRGEGSAHAWIFTFAYHQVRNYRRAQTRQRERTDSSDTALDLFESAQEVPAETVERRELTLRCLSELPVEQRAVLILHDIDGCTAREISEALKIPPGTVASRLRLARKGFAKHVVQLNASPPQSAGDSTHE